MSNEPNDKQLDENLKRLLGRGTRLPRLDGERRARMLDALKAQQAEQRPQEGQAMKIAEPVVRVTTWLALAASVAIAVLVGYAALRPRKPIVETVGDEKPFPVVVSRGEGAAGVLRKTLADGTILIARAGARLTVDGKRRLTVEAGDIYLIVAKAPAPFVVTTAHGTATAMGTRFGLSVGAKTVVAVAQGVVKLDGEAGTVDVAAGQKGELAPGQRPTRAPAPRLSYIVSWARDALAQVSRLVEKAKRDSGELVAKDPWGQEVRLTLRKYHVDVHIEDGIARTTIDQTYFNHMPWQIEGTFYFPLPPDASVSRLAMYVNGTLNEGGMVSRERGQEIYTEIKFQRRDPALLEMQEGNVFKMRIFPIEGRQEKRIFLSYTQKLDELYGTLRYWFPMDHTHSNAREVSLHVRAKGAAGKYVAESSTHELGINEDGGDLVMNWHAKDVKPDQDLLLHLLPTEQAARRSFTTCEKDGTTYVFGRVTPSLPGEVKPQPRQWIVLNDVSASRSRLDVQAQSYILERLLAEADDGDTIALVNLNTKAQVVGKPFLAVRAPAAKGLLEAATVDLPLGGTHIAAGLEAAARLITQHKCANPHILYLGDGVATDGKTEVDLLLKRIPEGATFVGIGVGKKADQRFLQAAADQTGGLFALINPDEDIDWRVFDLVAALNTPRLVGITARFEDAAGRAAAITAYPSARALADGETLFVVGRTQGRAPAWLVLEGTVGDERLEHRYALADARTDGAFIPRFWAKRHIDELLKSGTEHKDEIVKLSMQYYVMTPYTSLIVLEDDKMYEQYKVERGRSDHWALYPAPKTIKVVKEPIDRSQYDWYWGYQSEDGKVKAKARPTSIKDIVESVQFRINAPFYFWQPQRLGQGRFALYNLVDLDADPSGLLTWLVNKAGVTPTGAAGGPAGQKQPGPSRRYDEPPTTPVSAEMMPPALILARGERSRRPTFTSFYFQPAALRLFDVSDLPSASRLSHEFGDVGIAFDTDKYGYYETHFSRLSSASGLVTAGESLPSSILSLGADYDVSIAPLGVLVDNSKSMQFKKVLAPATLAGGATADGKFGGYLGFLPPQLQFRFERALGERRGRIQHDVREYNRRWGGYGWEGGGWYYGNAWNSLDLRKGHSARLYGGLEGLKEDDEALPPLAMTSAPSQPMPAGAIMAGKRLYTPSLAIAVYGQAIKTVPGTGPALAADFLVPRRDALLKEARDEKDEKILKAIQAALDGLEAAYPRFEDSGVFWGYQGWNYRPQPWTFQPPQVQCHQWYNWSFDLTRYASALYSTNADVLNEVVAAYPQKAAGTVSDEARQLIAAARKAIQPVRIRFGDSGPAMLVAAGRRFALTHTTDMYLEERMVCDGKSIVHLYPELGLAARRAATPLRLAALRRVAPHLIEPADWLARRYEVTLAEQGGGRFVLKLAPIVQVAQPPSAVKPPFHMLLVANTDGRIREKSLFVKGKLQLKLAYAYDAGEVTARWSDGEGKELATAAFTAEPFEPKPDTFAADLATFVVIDMPLRRPSYYEAQIAKLAKGADKLLPSLYRHLALAHIQELNWRRWGGQNPKVLEAVKKLAEVVGKTADGQLALKLGDITLLGSAGQRHIAAQWIAKSGIPKDHPVLAYYELMRQGWQKMDSLSSRVADGIVGHLAAYHAAFAEGQNKKAGTKAIDRFLKDFADSPLAFAIVWYRSQWHNRHGEWTRLFDHPRWRSLAILMAAQRANTPALRKQVAEAFAKLHAELSEKGIEVPISANMHNVLRSADGGKHWKAIMAAAHKVAADSKRAAPMLRFAETAFRCGETKLADEALDAVRKMASKPDSLLVRLALAQTYWAGTRYKEALTLYDEAFATLQQKGIVPSPALLASVARLAQQAGNHGRAIDLEEQALAAEHPYLPELINLNAFRQRYQWLWNQYQAKMSEAAGKKDAAAVAQWLGRAELLWARWRTVDADNPSMAQQMATLQMTAGDRDAAWLYLSSLIDAKPRDPSSHAALAQWYRGRKQFAEAEQYLARAYTWDTANPHWLLERAKVLHQMKRTDDARRMLQQIIDGKWAPGLQRYINRAKAEMKKL